MCFSSSAYLVDGYYSYLVIIICEHLQLQVAKQIICTVILFQIFLSNTNSIIIIMITMIILIIECSKLAQKKYKTRHEWVGKVTHRKLCKKLKFDHSTK